MPTYEYACPLGHQFEKFQRITEKPRARCPICGKPATRKISGGAGLLFKGTGFYITDYGKDGKGPRKPAEGEGRPAAESKTASEKPGETTGSKRDTSTPDSSLPKKKAAGE